MDLAISNAKDPLPCNHISANPTANNIRPSATNSTTLPNSVALVPVTCGVAPDVSEFMPDVMPGNSATATSTPTNMAMMAPTNTLPIPLAAAMSVSRIIPVRLYKQLPIFAPNIYKIYHHLIV
jgi:hypothetical protein